MRLNCDARARTGYVVLRSVVRQYSGRIPIHRLSTSAVTPIQSAQISKMRRSTVFVLGTLSYGESFELRTLMYKYIYSYMYMHMQL